MHPRDDTASKHIRVKAQEVFQQVFSECDEEYDKRIVQLRELRHLFHQEMAAALESAFNRKLSGMNSDDISAKRALCTWVNAELRSVGLAVQCPVTHLASILVAHTARSGDVQGRFLFELARDASGHAYRKCSRVVLPSLTLLERTTKREGRTKSANKPETDDRIR